MSDPASLSPRRLVGSPARWWRVDLPTHAVLGAELDPRGDARAVSDWIQESDTPVELCFVLGNAGRWGGLRVGLRGLGTTPAAARAAARTLGEGLDDTGEAYGWPLVPCEPPGPLPCVGLPLGLPEGSALDRRDGVLDQTRARLTRLLEQERTAVLRLSLRLDPVSPEVQQGARAAVGSALRAMRVNRGADPSRSMALAERARDLHVSSVGMVAELSLHVDVVPGAMVLDAVRVDLGKDLGSGLRWGTGGPMLARPSLLPGALALLSAAPLPARSAGRVLAFPG